jgi:hypothetical protein
MLASHGRVRGSVSRNLYIMSEEDVSFQGPVFVLRTSFLSLLDVPFAVLTLLI